MLKKARQETEEAMLKYDLMKKECERLKLELVSEA